MARVETVLGDALMGRRGDLSSWCWQDLCLNCPLLQTVQQSKCNLDLRVKLNFHNVVCILCKPGAMRISFFLDLER